ncbi:uncharacterized protein BDV17DRAFT_291835 [Aspergillus undulatus]|uniref:uncharacterized protein n=1 Tax=Aspergillus undulatus TaxID=1810928 RepID=UPI003CCE1D78
MDSGFHFISIHVEGDAKDKALRRQARSHAVKTALEKKRKHHQRSRNNFAITTLGDFGKPNETAIARPYSRIHSSNLPRLLQGALDPFQTLAVDSSRLQVLLADYRARQAPEPVFSMASELAFQSFRSVFRSGLHDPALANAVMLALAFAVTGGSDSLDQDCLRYQSQAITYIRERMDSVDEAASEATIGAILLIAGVVARLGLTAQVELHMGAVQRLLEICRAKSIYLTPGIKQDLNATILAGSRRIVSHTTFAELLWTRDPLVPNFYALQPGFQSRSDILGLSKEFRAVLEDLHALQCIRDTGISRMPEAKADAMFMLHVNNHTASIQSRLVAVSHSGLALTRLQECVRLVAYLCSVTLCCKVWCGLVIPSHISTQLLTKLGETRNTDTLSPILDEDLDLLLWLLCIGGAFAPMGPVRSGYLQLLRLLAQPPSYCSWPRVYEAMTQFIWSDRAFMVPVRMLWEEALRNQFVDEGAAS